MKKILITMIGLTLFLNSTTTQINKEMIKINSNQKWNNTKIWKFKEFIVQEYKQPAKWLYFAIDNINLTSIGIKNIQDLHSYTTIEIPGIRVKYDHILDLSGDTWGTNRKIGTEEWYEMFNKSSNCKVRVLESAATLWNSKSGDLMMRLSYRAHMFTYIPPIPPPKNISNNGQIIGGTITFISGSEIKIY